MITKKQRSILLELADSQNSTFVDLVKIAGLDPETAFRSADLRGVDFIGCDLKGFDFTEADLSGASFRGASARGIILDRAILKGVVGLRPDEPILTETQTLAINAARIDSARWIICGFGRAALTALRSREINSRQDFFILSESNSENIHRFSSLAQSRSQNNPCELVFVCDPGSEHISAAIDAAAAVRGSPPSLAIIYRSDRFGLKASSLSSRGINGFIDRTIIVDSHVEVFKGRTRFTPGRLIRSYLDTLSSANKSFLASRSANDWTVFSLGSHPNGVRHAVSSLEHAIASSINPLIDTLSASDLQITIMSVGRPNLEIEDDLNKLASSKFQKATDRIYTSWNKLNYSGYSVPVQAGILARGQGFHRPERPAEGFFLAVQRTFDFCQSQWKPISLSTGILDYSVDIQGKSVRISAVFEENGYNIIERGVIYCVQTTFDRKKAFSIPYSENFPILLLSELPFILDSNNPFKDAMYISRINSNKDSLKKEFSGDVADYIRNELFSSPNSYDLYRPLQDLSRSTIIDDVNINIEKAIKIPDFSVKFTGTLHISVELDYGDEVVNTSDSYEGYFECIISPNGPKLVSATVDTSKFYE